MKWDHYFIVTKVSLTKQGYQPFIPIKWLESGNVGPLLKFHFVVRLEMVLDNVQKSSNIIFIDFPYWLRDVKARNHMMILACEIAGKPYSSNLCLLTTLHVFVAKSFYQLYRPVKVHYLHFHTCLEFSDWFF